MLRYRQAAEAERLRMHSVQLAETKLQMDADSELCDDQLQHVLPTARQRHVVPMSETAHKRSGELVRMDHIHESALSSRLRQLHPSSISLQQPWLAKVLLQVPAFRKQFVYPCPSKVIIISLCFFFFSCHPKIIFVLTSSKIARPVWIDFEKSWNSKIELK